MSLVLMEIKFVTTVESLPNEILLNILSHLSWFDQLASFWSLNIRFNSLLYLTFSGGNNRLNNGLFATHGLPYQKCHSILHSLISHSSSLCSSIESMINMFFFRFHDLALHYFQTSGSSDWNPVDAEKSKRNGLIWWDPKKTSFFGQL